MYASSKAESDDWIKIIQWKMVLLKCVMNMLHNISCNAEHYHCSAHHHTTVSILITTVVHIIILQLVN